MVRRIHPVLMMTLVIGLFVGTLGAEFQCPAATDARPSLEGLQTQIDGIKDDLCEPLAKGRYQLVGFTAATFTGDVGALALTLGCQSEFGGESRMCTSAEVVETVSVPAVTAGFSWVRPVFQPKSVSVGSTTSLRRAMDVSGTQTEESTQSNLSCRGWSAALNNDGLGVDSDGRFSEVPCEIARSVACCAQIP